MEFVCTLCPRRCGALRTDTVGHGFCRMPAAPVVARAALHFGEEPCISGQRGSGTVFFAGCTLRCAFCQNREISRGPVGKSVSIERLSAIFRELVAQGAANINLVNPTHYAAAIRDALTVYRPPVPVVYNSGGYETVETLRSLEGLVDVYLPDIKYLSSTLSGALSGATDYATFACDAILEMARQTGPAVFDEQEMLTRGTVVRHLVLPGHTAESLAVIDWLAAHLPQGTLTSLMFQYTPMASIEGFPELSRRLTRRECDKMWDYLANTDLEGYVQDRESAGTQMIPAFDMTGV